jgi:hypothetical protein
MDLLPVVPQFTTAVDAFKHDLAAYNRQDLAAVLEHLHAVRV